MAVQLIRDNPLLGAKQDFNQVLSRFRGRADEANRRSELSVYDLFGDAIQRSTDQVRSQANATKSNIARLSGATGGDITGAGNVAMSKVDEGANKQVADLFQFFSDRAHTSRDRSRARGDDLLRTMLGGQRDRLSLETAAEERDLQRELAKKQRRSQLWSDIIGLIGNVGSAGVGKL